MQVLVTGCAGFIGRRVCELLLAEGHRVVGVDNLNDAYDARLKHWRLKHLSSNPAFTFHRLDITDFDGMKRLFLNEGYGERGSYPSYGAVVNLAARAGVHPSLRDPWLYYNVNLIGTLNLLELCRTHGVEKFVQASTSSVYGEAERPFREDSLTDRPLSPYAASKKAAESLCYTYHRLYGLDVTVFRYFTVYGPAGRPDMSVFRFIKWVAEDRPLILYGDGSQERDFTYVDDIARGTLLGLKPLGYQVINLGGDRPVAINTIIGLVEKLLGKKALIEYHPANPADIPASWADISKARRILGWEPETSVEEGLGEAAGWYGENRVWVEDIRL